MYIIKCFKPTKSKNSHTITNLQSLSSSSITSTTVSFYLSMIKAFWIQWKMFTHNFWIHLCINSECWCNQKCFNGSTFLWNLDFTKITMKFWCSWKKSTLQFCKCKRIWIECIIMGIKLSNCISKTANLQPAMISARQI